MTESLKAKRKLGNENINSICGNAIQPSNISPSMVMWRMCVCVNLQSVNDRRRSGHAMIMCYQ